jgi:PTH1 family peptidyl-tRNA hydrolase
MKLVVGLGNPGRKYHGTRHNIGFAVIGRLVDRYGSGKVRVRNQGELTEANLGGVRVLLLCPQTYMNRSGSSVQPACDFYKIEPHDLLVICDDFNLQLGKIRFRRAGSAGGQKGLADIIQRMGSDAVPRLRIGIGPVPERWDPADFVLGRFSADDVGLADEMVGRATDATVAWVNEDIEHCMNQFNG